MNYIDKDGPWSIFKARNYKIMVNQNLNIKTTSLITSFDWSKEVPRKNQSEGSTFAAKGGNKSKNVILALPLPSKVTNKLGAEVFM